MFSENFSYHCNMIVQQYLKQCSVKSVDDLTDKQVIAFFNAPDIYIGQRCAVRNALRYCEKFGISKNRVIQSIRMSMKGDGEFKFCYITNESADGPSQSNGRWVIEP